MVEAYLSARGIVYEERDVSRSPAAVFELVRTYKSRITPTVVIGKEVIIGFYPTRLDELLDEEP